MLIKLTNNIFITHFAYPTAKIPSLLFGMFYLPLPCFCPQSSAFLWASSSSATL